MFRICKGLQTPEESSSSACSSPGSLGALDDLEDEDDLPSPDTEMDTDAEGVCLNLLVCMHSNSDDDIYSSTR